ncbi:MAG: hypothetical protein KGL39_28495 [Patescibacteria group bacterium]|nr:hypothetical protein [Patescibacteria group bacterium]
MSITSLETKALGVCACALVVAVSLGYAHYEKGRADAAHAQLLVQAAQYRTAAKNATVAAAKQAAMLKASADQLAAQLAAANTRQQVKLQAVTKIIRTASGPCLDQPVPPAVLKALQNTGAP